MHEPITKFCLTDDYWQVNWSPDKFDKCSDKDCNYANEHEYKCDGQFFYAPKKPTTKN